MAKHSQEELHAVELKVIGIVQEWRTNPNTKLRRDLLKDPHQLMRHMIMKEHGNPRLRCRNVAEALGFGWRTLQRKFIAEFHMPMKAAAIKVRYEYAQTVLRRIDPTDPKKISEVADHLGYDAEQDFIRFFQKRMHMSPAKWSKSEREKAAAKAEQLFAQDRGTSS